MAWAKSIMQANMESVCPKTLWQNWSVHPCKIDCAHGLSSPFFPWCSYSGAAQRRIVRCMSCQLCSWPGISKAALLESWRQQPCELNRLCTMPDFCCKEPCTANFFCGNKSYKLAYQGERTPGSTRCCSQVSFLTKAQLLFIVSNEVFLQALNTVHLAHQDFKAADVWGRLFEVFHRL